MTYDPVAYWSSKPGGDVREWGEQERVLSEVMSPLAPSSVLEVGIGTGRVAAILTERWPGASYVGIDLSAARLAQAREYLPAHVELYEADLFDYSPGRAFDLVVATEVLMHVRPSDLRRAVGRLRSWSAHWVLTCDWVVPIGGEVAPWNFCHDYQAVGLPEVARVGLQGVHLWKRKTPRSLARSPRRV